MNGQEVIENTTDSLGDNDLVTVKQSGKSLKFFKLSKLWTWIWNLVKNNTRSTLDTTDKTPVNSSAIENILSPKNYTITFTGDGAGTIEQNVYNTDVIKIGNIYLCTFDILFGEITENKVAFMLISSLNSSGYRGNGVLNTSDGETYFLSSLGNKNVWIYQNGNRVRTNIFSNKRIKGYIVYYPYSAPSPMALEE